MGLRHSHTVKKRTEFHEIENVSNTRNYRGILLWAFGVTLAADVLSKALIFHFLGNSVVGIIGDVKLRILYNSDAPIGLGNSPLGILALGAAGLAVVLIFRWAWQTNSSGSLYVGLMTGGAFGNLLDRLIGGSVLDWIDDGFHGGFKLADVAIPVGLAFFLTTQLFGSPPEGRDESPKDLPTADEPA